MANAATSLIVRSGDTIIATLNLSITLPEDTPKSIIRKLVEKEITVEGVSQDSKLALSILALLKHKGAL